MARKHLITFLLLITGFAFVSISAQEQTKPREIIARKSTTDTAKPETTAADSEAEPPIAIKKELKEILADNSYFVEIANNIEPGKLHTINNCVKYPSQSRDVECSVTQEVAFNGGKQMISYTAPFSFLSSPKTTGLGDVTMTYKYQFTTDEHFAVVSTRVSVIVPSGNTARGLGDGAAGIQVNIPFTKRLSNSFLGNFNVGSTFFPKMKGEDAEGNSVKRNLSSFNTGGSLIWVAHRNVNPLVENVKNFSSEIGDDGNVNRFNEHIVSPGVGMAWKFKGFKFSPGFAVPISFSQGERRTGYYFYIGFEHDFFKKLK